MPDVVGNVKGNAMDEVSPSMGIQDWDRGHRELKVHKVENGFVIEARFYRKRRSGQGQYDSSESREFVFSAEASMLGFVADYFGGRIKDAIKG